MPERLPVRCRAGNACGRMDRRSRIRTCWADEALRWPLPGRQRPGERCDGAIFCCSGKRAGRREKGLLLRNDIDDVVLAVLDVEDELAQESLVILLAQGLVALR